MEPGLAGGTDLVRAVSALVGALTIDASYGVRARRRWRGGDYFFSVGF